MRNEKKFKLGIIIFSLILSFYMIIIFRLLHIQVFGDSYINEINTEIKQKVKKFTLNRKIFRPIRGNIYTRNNRLLATTIYKYRVFLDGKIINESSSKNQIINILKSQFPLNRNKLLKKIKNEDRYIPISRRENREKIESLSDIFLENNDNKKQNFNSKLKKLKKIGIYCRKDDPKRVYPRDDLASHVVGYINYANQGIGIEGEFNEFLKGKQSTDINDMPKDGGDIYLTIDDDIQYYVEKGLRWGYKKYNPVSVSAVVLKPDTGEILAMANYPTYNPNFFYKIRNKSKLTNKAISYSFEPGSTFKLITLAGAIEENLVNKNMVINCNNGVIKYKGEIIRDTLRNDDLTLKEVFEKSSNVGVIKIADMLGKEKLYYYAKLFGFTENKTIELSNESNAFMRNPDKWSPPELANFSIGYGLATNLLRLTNAYSVIANGGKLVQPHIISRVHNFDKEAAVSPIVIRRVLDSKSAEKVKDILVSVVENGSASRTKMENLKIAGKTGTAVIFNREKFEYDNAHFIGTFVGFFPADNPEYVMGIMVNQPKVKGYASKFAVPIFKKITENIVKNGDM